MISECCLSLAASMFQTYHKFLLEKINSESYLPSPPTADSLDYPRRADLMAVGLRPPLMSRGHQRCRRNGHRAGTAPFVSSDTQNSVEFSSWQLNLDMKSRSLFSCPVGTSWYLEIQAGFLQRVHQSVSGVQCMCRMHLQWVRRANPSV